MSDTSRVSIQPDAPVATAALAAATGRVSRSTRPDPERSGAMELRVPFTRLLHKAHIYLDKVHRYCTRYTFALIRYIFVFSKAHPCLYKVQGTPLPSHLHKVHRYVYKVHLYFYQVHFYLYQVHFNVPFRLSPTPRARASARSPRLPIASPLSRRQHHRNLRWALGQKQTSSIRRSWSPAAKNQRTNRTPRGHVLTTSQQKAAPGTR